MTPLIDSHCHLADPKLRDDLEAILERATAAGVGYIVAVGAIGSIETDRLTVEIAERHANVFAVVGVHPHDAKDCDSTRVGQLRELAKSKKVVAIGETGLDFHYMHSPPDAQQSSLRRHLELAGEFGLPLVIHCRDAESSSANNPPQRPAASRKVIEIVREVGIPPAGGMAHCFTGDQAAAFEFLALGFHISFSGIATFKNAGTLRETARLVPDDRILIETDAPYLTPEPHRGRRNEPAYLPFTLEALAKTREITPERLTVQVLANARRLFRIS